MSTTKPPLQYITARKAAQIDTLLMSSETGYTLPQLMELAGLSVAQSIHDNYPPSTHPTIQIFCGPGNNGGDGLVAARHLALFAYSVSVIVPRTKFSHLVRSAAAHHVRIETDVHAALAEPVDVLVDAVFGFSFDGTGGVREPYRALLESLWRSAAKIACVDVPSGWDVDQEQLGDGRVPDMVVSLTAPKICVKGLDGREGFAHYVGGRFVPRAVCEEAGVEIVAFPGAQGFVRV